MKYIGILLHIYQPPTNLKEIVQKIADTSYIPLMKVINAEQNAKFSLNINYSLTEQLVKYGYHQLIDSIKEAADTGKIEFTESGAYHPIFPLIPENEMIRQLTLNYQGNKDVFGNCFQPKGIFPPECALSENVIKILAKHWDFQWIITDDQPYSCYHHGQVPYNFIPQVDNKAVFLRSNMWSNRIAWNTWGKANFINVIKRSLNSWFNKNDGYLILAMDGETFGWHHKHYEEHFLRKMLLELKAENDITLCTLSEILEKFPLKEDFIPPSSWSTSIEDVNNNDTYSLWHSRFNPIHQSQWDLTNHFLNCIKKIEISDEKLRGLIDKSLYSCPYWWAQNGQFFSPKQIYRGANLIIKALEQYSLIVNDYEALNIGKELYREIIYQVKKRQHGV